MTSVSGPSPAPRRACTSLSTFLQGDLQAFEPHRLGQVVDRLQVEGGHGVFGVGGDEHHGGLVGMPRRAWARANPSAPGIRMSSSTASNGRRRRPPWPPWRWRPPRRPRRTARRNRTATFAGAPARATRRRPPAPAGFPSSSFTPLVVRAAAPRRRPVRPAPRSSPGTRLPATPSELHLHIVQQQQPVAHIVLCQPVPRPPWPAGTVFVTLMTTSCPAAGWRPSLRRPWRWAPRHA
jgi:hypothetical protein